jgi:hypothetical protein
MQLKYKPDLDRAKKYFEALWKNEIIDRPCIVIQAPNNEFDTKPHPPYMDGVDGQYEKALKRFDEWASSTYFAGEAVPFFDISYGPDQFSAFLGAELTLVKEPQSTSWVKPFITDWKKVDISLKKEPNSIWDKIINYFKFAAKFSEGKFLLSMIDLHSNVDCLSAIRGPQDLCVDIMDCSDDVEKTLMEVRKLFIPVYSAIYEAGDMEKRGSIGWEPYYCERKFATIACDFICMLGPEDGKRFVIPALEEEASFLDHCVYHYDGPTALQHLDNILAIKKIDAIQWEPGEGYKPRSKWIDLYKKIQKSGKGLSIYCESIDELKFIHKELNPKGILYRVDAKSRKEADEIISWLKNNT